MERVRDPAVLEWLHGCKPEEVATGFDATGWEANIWILHAMYETDALPSGISHDDVHKIERAAGAISPVMIGELDLEEILADSTLVGSPLGRSGWPGQGWKRLRWYELARRLNIDPFASDDVPGFRAFPTRAGLRTLHRLARDRSIESSSSHSFVTWPT